MKNKMKPSVGVFVKDEADVQFVKSVIDSYDFNVHLSFHARNDLDLAPSLIGDYEDNITSIHLPNGLGALDFRPDGVVTNLSEMFNVDLFVIHPWIYEMDEVVETVVNNGLYTLCLENFPAKSRKRNSLADPVYAVGKYGKYLEGDFLGLCIDFSHLDTGVSNYTFLRSFIPYTKILHVSSRLGKAQHLPIFKRTEEINPNRLLSKLFTVPDLKIREVVLEYMAVYRKNLIKDQFWLIQYMQQKRKKFGDV